MSLIWTGDEVPQVPEWRKVIEAETRKVLEVKR